MIMARKMHTFRFWFRKPLESGERKPELEDRLGANRTCPKRLPRLGLEEGKNPRRASPESISTHTYIFKGISITTGSRLSAEPIDVSK